MEWLKAVLLWIVGIPERIMRFWFPYLFYFDDENPEPRRRLTHKEKREKRKREKQQKKNKKSKDNNEQTLADVDAEKPEDVLEFKEDELGVKIVEVSEPFDKKEAFDTMKKSTSNLAYSYHDGDYHQIAVKFKPHSMKVHYKTRDNAARKELEPKLYPKDVQFDRTHVIPIGYHGSENDSRLLVGFDSKINRLDLKSFEDRVAYFNRKQTILWFVSIDRQDDNTAIWNAIVWDEKGSVLIETSLHDRHKFAWFD
ncbi:hypothetical protein ACR56S_04345 [Staphylococcus hominis]|uniref:hypothetical protein n=1 Tax=Staphylococcus hominis TaxID=1290 RepID=UPI003DA1304E